MTQVSLADLFKATGGGSGTEPVPAGMYRLQVTSAKSKVESQQVVPVFKIVGGPDDGRKVMAGVFSFGSEAAAGISFQNLAGFGFDRAYFEGGGGIESLAQDLVGRVVDVELIVDQWPKNSDQYRNKIAIGKVTFVGQAQTQLPSIGAAPTAVPLLAPAPAPAPVTSPEVPVATSQAPVLVPTTGAAPPVAPGEPSF